MSHYFTCFTSKYWKSAFKEWGNFRKVVLAAILMALIIATDAFSRVVGIMVFGRFVYFTFIPVAVAAMLLGPVMIIPVTALANTISYFIYSSGYPFFIGYTLNAVLQGVFFALLLYNQKITILKIFVTRLLNNLLVNALLGALWKWILFSTDQVFTVLLVDGLIKNLIMLPMEVFILYIILKALLIPSREYLYLPDDTDMTISLV